MTELTDELLQAAMRAFNAIDAKGYVATPNKEWVQKWLDKYDRLAAQPAQAAPHGLSLVPTEILDRFPELNPSNYDHDDACAINAWGVELVLAATVPAPVQAGEPVQMGWLIEHDGSLPGQPKGQVSWLFVQDQFHGFGAKELSYTRDANLALRFARKEDAEAVMNMYIGPQRPDWYTKLFSVTEHMWPEPRLSALPPMAAQESASFHALIAGALFDFLGYLTTRDETLKLGSCEHATPAVDALAAWAETRNLDLDEPAIKDWNKAVAAMLATKQEQP
jgi:hypothetical protein